MAGQLERRLKRVSYWRYLLYGLIVSLIVGLGHILIFGGLKPAEGDKTYPWIIQALAFVLMYAHLAVPSALFLAALNNSVWKRAQQRGMN